MNKYVLSLLFLLAAASVWGQSKSKVNLVSSTTMQAIPGPNGNRIIKVQNGVFRQDYSTLTSDSAYFYPDLNMVDAFSHVVINQGDTVHIYADKLNYNGNTKIAILTNHVKMVDKDAVLTTDNLTYNTATRIGTYVDGGKLVNKDNVLTSKNGYYFAFTRDAYFRYDVVCTTPDAVIKTDTMRYNSGTRINYFYGPTIITGKDKDNLYTENGTYNTVLKQARFGKKNLYTQGTKSLKGDSLFYDRNKGYGRAVKHVTFNDSEQRITLKGDLGEYFKVNELAVMTQNAYMIFVTEDSTAVKAAGKKTTDSLLNKPTADSLLKKAKVSSTDNLVKKMAAIGNAGIDKKLTLQAIKDSVTKKLPANAKLIEAAKTTALKNLTDTTIKKAITSGKLPASTTNANAKIIEAAKSAALKNLTDPSTKKALSGGKLPASTPKPNIKSAVKAVTKQVAQQSNTQTVFPKKVIPTFTPVYKYADTIRAVAKARPNIRYDSLFLVADTLTTQMVTYKEFKIIKQKQYDITHRDTSIHIVKKAAPIVYKKSPKFILLEPMEWPVDTSFIRREYFGKPKPPAPKAMAKITKASGPKKTAQDSLKEKQKADSLALLAPKELSDTTRIRMVRGYNHAKIYKSDLQAKADSMFYSSSDSTIRMYTNPMIWTQGSQLSGDTVNLQMKNKKLDNLDMFPAAFIVNLEKNDSTHYNQAGGKRMHGTFKNGKLSSFVIIGNAQTIYFKRDTVKNIVTDMTKTFSGKARFEFDKGELSSNSFADKYEGHGFPIGKVKEDDKILKGFIWKPKDRPISKESILSAYKNKPGITKTTTKGGKATGKTGKPGISKPGDIKLGKDSLDNKQSDLKMGKGSINNKPANIKLHKDTVTTLPAGIKARKDSVVKRDTNLMRKSIILKQ
ncbi:MAG: hypothetical protein JWQ34_3652 [Mucilaginibacter sp.]|uniref:OstA-like protein n=1 Tax=Mucilaginibacter sp. TaxID=1882438 RepID=UPI002633252D|nr:OstA-like protein [Mucilaginibacter sp.]MDB5005427.1 hypothetical protein [Mucilaginibacter sp.]